VYLVRGEAQTRPLNRQDRELRALRGSELPAFFGPDFAYLVSRYFGLRAFGEIDGNAFAACTLGGVVSPLLMGMGFEATGSYGPVLRMFVVATLRAAGLMTRLGPYRVVSHRLLDKR
jgi:hypothetical protein